MGRKWCRRWNVFSSDDLRLFNYSFEGWVREREDLEEDNEEKDRTLTESASSTSSRKKAVFDDAFDWEREKRGYLGVRTGKNGNG